MNKQYLLDELIVDIESEPQLDALRESASQIVRGAGSLNSKVVFIGEAPGRGEDESGVPFVGASGRILNEALLAVGLEREDIYITNIVKYRPPENRDPSSAEKGASWPYLLREIEIINPDIIVPLGRHSLSTILPEEIIGEAQGREYTVSLGGRDYVVIPLYHPAATIYNRSLRGEFNRGVEKINKMLESIN